MKSSGANHKSNQSNPNNVAHRQAINNRANQRNPNNPAYHSGRSAPAAPATSKK
jgi:hypothetical protein